MAGGDGVQQRIRFCRTEDDVQIAYAVAGDGPPLVKAPNYAARHPERVTELVLYGTYARGRFQRSDDPADRRAAEALLDLIARGRSNDEIAQELVISPATVRIHITRIFRTLEVRDRAQAVVVGREGGLGR